MLEVKPNEPQTRLVEKLRVSLGWVFNRWRQKAMNNDADLAEFLLDRFSTSYQTDGSVDKAVPRKWKRSPPPVHLKDEDVWVNLSCLLQLFQECGRCRGVCTVSTQEDRSHFSVIQYCRACSHCVLWNSQPLKSTSTEDGENRDVQVPVSSPRDDTQGRQKATTTGSETETASETEAWNEEHFVELDVNIDSDFSDELSLCGLEDEDGDGEEEEETGEEEEEEVGEEEEEKGEKEELVGQQSDEMREEDVGQTEKHREDIKETEKHMSVSVERTVEVKEEDEEQAVDEVTEEDEWQRKGEEEVDDWLKEEEEEQQQQQGGDSQTSDSDFEIRKPVKRRRPRMRGLFENEGIDDVTEDEEWEEEDEDEEEEDEDEEEWSSEEQKAHSKKIKLVKSRHRMRPVYLKRVYLSRCTQRLCPDCGVMYSSQTHVCNAKKKFPCPKCGKRRLSELNVNAHIIHCKGLVFPCRFCLAPFESKVDKVKHENRHRDTEKPYLCSKCPETFADFFTRNRHLKGHQVLTCRTCQKQFSVVHALRRHERSHLDDKPFKCHVCERAFAQGNQLKSHLRVHTGERPYKCQLCPMRFNHNISLKTHIRRYHQNESHVIGPQSHPDSGEQRVTPKGPSSALASGPREQGESLCSEKGPDPCQEPQPSKGSTEPGEVHSMTVQESGKGEVAESVFEDQGGLTLQTQLEISEREGGGNACDSRPKRKRQRSRWRDSDFAWGGEEEEGEKKS